jgi:hypothetical protein
MPRASDIGCQSKRSLFHSGQTIGNITLNQQDLSGLLWSVADLLRGDYKQSDYGKVILPFTVLRRIDCVLAPTREAVLAELALR